MAGQSVFPDGFEVKVYCPLTTADAPSLPASVSASSAKAEADASVARKIQTAPSSRLVVISLFLCFCCSALLGRTVGLNGFPF